MRGHVLCWLSLLTVLAVASEPFARGYGKGQATVGFDLYRDYLIVARGSAGPLKDLNVLIDTGTNPTVLDRRLAQKLHLEELPASIAMLNGSMAAGRAVVPSLEIGPLRRDNFPVVVEDLSFFQKTVPVRIDAVIGLDVLGQCDFEIDYLARQIRFGPSPPLAISLPLHLKQGLAVVDGQLDHVSVPLLVDTGAFSVVLFAPQTPMPASPMKISAVQGSPYTVGEFERKQVWLHSLRLGEAEFGREPASVVRSLSGGHDFEGLMSPRALGITKLAFNLERGLLGLSR